MSRRIKFSRFFFLPMYIISSGEKQRIVEADLFNSNYLYNHLYDQLLSLAIIFVINGLVERYRQS